MKTEFETITGIVAYDAKASYLRLLSPLTRGVIWYKFIDDGWLLIDNTAEADEIEEEYVKSRKGLK